jgi:hypothetical protein
MSGMHFILLFPDEYYCKWCTEKRDDVDMPVAGHSSEPAPSTTIMDGSSGNSSVDNDTFDEDDAIDGGHSTLTRRERLTSNSGSMPSALVATTSGSSTATYHSSSSSSSSAPSECVRFNVARENIQNLIEPMEFVTSHLERWCGEERRSREGGGVEEVFGDRLGAILGGVKTVLKEFHKLRDDIGVRL